MDRDQSTQPVTGVQVHWPIFDNQQNPGSRTSAESICRNHQTLLFHTDHDPSAVVYYTRKRNMFSRDPSHDTSPATPRSFSDDVAVRRDPASAKAKSNSRIASSGKWTHELIKSTIDDHSSSASELCTVKGSAGPSFVTYEGREFCFMPTKTLFQFCDDVESGACWDDEINAVVPKLVDSLVPAMNFTKISHWKTKIYRS